MEKKEIKHGLYIVARTADKVWWSVYEDKAKDTLDNIGHDGVHVDMIVYSCPVEVVEVYQERIGDHLVPFALSFYGTIKARSQGAVEEKVREFLNSCDKAFGLPAHPTAQ